MIRAMLSEDNLLKMEANMEELAIRKSIDDPYYDETKYYERLDRMIMTITTRLRQAGIPTPAGRCLQYFEQLRKEDDVWDKWCENPKTGNITMDFYQRLYDTMYLNETYKKQLWHDESDKRKIMQELRKRGLLKNGK